VFLRIADVPNRRGFPGPRRPCRRTCAATGKLRLSHAALRHHLHHAIPVHESISSVRSPHPAASVTFLPKCFILHAGVGAWPRHAVALLKFNRFVAAMCPARRGYRQFEVVRSPSGCNVKAIFPNLLAVLATALVLPLAEISVCQAPTPAGRLPPPHTPEPASATAPTTAQPPPQAGVTLPSMS